MQPSMSLSAGVREMPKELSLDGAQELVRGALKASGEADATILPEFTTERPFGWVFVAAPSLPDVTSRVNPATARIIIVNKYSNEVFAASIGSFIENCLATYEGILRTKGRDWCGSLRPARGLWRARGFEWMLEKAGLKVLAPKREAR